MHSEQQYIELYGECRELIRRHSTGVMNALRDDAFARFQSLGFPSQKVERYKYVDIQRAFAPNYGLNLSRIPIPVRPQEVFKCDVPNLSTNLAYVVNDEPMLDGQPYVASIRKAAETHADLLKRHYGQLASANDAITALNTALAQDGLFIYIPRNQHMDKPLQVVNILRSDVDLMVNRRVLIILEDNTSATLLFCDHAMNTVRFLSTQVVEVFCGNNASLDMYDLEETHTSCHRFSNVYVRADRDSRVSLNSITLYNGLTRNTTDVVLAGENADVRLDGCVVADKRQFVDNNTLIDHQAPHCTSNELYKYVLDDNATGAFAGRILVRKDAQKTSSQETNANLCASPDARMYTQPMLEIYADDVKCSHGSTVGLLDQQALFYMRQRGIAENDARLLLKNAFIGQVVDRITLEPLRNRLRLLVEKRFRGELNKCTGCTLCK